MLEFDGINYWAVLVAWLINIAVGAFWYSPAGFAKAWQKHTGINLLKIPQKKATQTVVSVALSAVFQALTLAVIIHSLHVTTATNGFIIGFVLWLGLTVATTVGVTLYSNRSWKFLWLNSSYFMLVMLVNSVILAVWR
jgi:uncharacterized protein DUF1761